LIKQALGAHVGFNLILWNQWQSKLGPRLTAGRDKI